MRLNEIKPVETSQEELNEVDLKKALAGGAFALSTLLAPTPTHDNQNIPPTTVQRADMDASVLASSILKKYNVSPKLALTVAKLAKKYEKQTFPKAEDILAIAGIESSFRPNAVSKLKKDPAVGLMQVRPGVWDLNPSKLINSVEMQIKTGSDILHKYYKLLGNAEDAVHAYNVGLGNFRKGKHNPRYVPKYKNELNLYKT